MLQSIFGYRRPAPGFQPQTRTAIKQMSVAELYSQMEAGQTPLLVDVRSPEEYEWDGHIEGSRLLPLQMLMQRADELPKDQPIVVVCRSGNRSQVACEQLAAAGFENLANLAGGMMDWKRHGYPSK
ncbi:MAG: rhodanese-like domain-containing protein [Anaerolineae bacterium]